jgi:hypothetical protein
MITVKYLPEREKQQYGIVISTKRRKKYSTAMQQLPDDYAG